MTPTKRNLLLSLMLAATPAASPAAPATTKPTPQDLIEQFAETRPPEYDQAKHDDKQYNATYDAALKSFFTRRIAIAKKFADLYPDRPESPELLEFAAQATDDPFEKNTVYRRLASQYPDTDEGKDAANHVRRDDAVGKPLKLAFTDAITGHKVDLKDYHGKLVLLDFWATWCPMCVEAMPHLKSLYQKYHDQGLEVLGIDLDAPPSEGGLDSLKQFVADNQIPWPQFYQGNGWDSPFSHSYGIDKIPAMFVVAPDGKVVSTHAEPEDLDTLVPKLLPKAAQPPAK